MDQSIDAESLASQLEQLTLNEQRQGILPSPRQLFAVGRILFRIPSEEDGGYDLFFAYQHLVDSLPDSHWDYVWSCFQKAAKTLVYRGNLEDLIAATESWCGLLTRAPKLCQILYSKEWISTFSMIYDSLMVKDATLPQKHVLLATLSSLLLDGLFLQSSSSLSSTKESLQEQVLEAIQAMEQHSTDCLADLQVWQNQKEPFRRTLASAVRKHTTAATAATENMEQWEYILDMLQSVQQRDASTSRIAITSTSSNTFQQASVAITKPVSAADELERRIQQVKQILPDYGEGFIETALSLYQGNVETTIATLFSEDSPSYPAALRVLDKSLPRRRKHRSEEEAAQAVEARQLVKERVAMEQKQQEAQYKALLYIRRQEEKEDENVTTKSTPTRNMSLPNEYDDDYDDQYDDIDVRLGGADDGMYDFEQVKLYNKFVRAEEADDAFWKDNQNTNRKPASNNKKNNNNNNKPSQNEDEATEDGGSKQYRGPDKIKGGRIIGPDGKVVRKPGAGKKPPNTNPDNNASPAGPAKATNGGGPKSTTNGTTTGGNSTTTTGGSDSTKNKPRTKPKAQNKVNRQRDKKQRAQGTFGVQD